MREKKKKNMTLCSRSTLSSRFLSLSHDFKAARSCNEPSLSYAEHLSDIISDAGAWGKKKYKSVTECGLPMQHWRARLGVDIS